MSNPRKIYWDSSCFLCFLNPDEGPRRSICEDILKQAELGNVEIWISVWVKVEVIRPKRPANAPLPEWAFKCVKEVPEAKKPLEELWKRFQRSSPSPKLTSQQIAKIEQMFEWPFLKKIYLDERVANKAVELCRDFGLRPADAVHAASAILTKCDVLQRWDKDFDKIKGQIAVEEPQHISAQSVIPFETPKVAENENEQAKESSAVTPTTELQGSGGGHPEGKTDAQTAKEKSEVKPPTKAEPASKTTSEGKKEGEGA